jgi:PAS domain S-box-containing protein
MDAEQSQNFLCSKIVDGCGDAVMFADRQGIIRLWNGAAERMFGYTESEALGQSLDLIIPENLRGRHWEGYFRVMGNGTSRYSTEMLSAPALRKDGTRISTEFSMVIIKDEEEIVGVAAIARDVTARWQREKVLKERIRVLEGSIISS